MQQSPIFSLTRRAASAINAHRFVDYQGNECAADEATIGVSAYDAPANADFTVHTLGTAKVVAGGVFADGDPIKVGAGGKAIAQAGAGTIVARALQAATAADQLVEVLLLPK